MNKEQPKQFYFLFPVSNMLPMPAQHVTNLMISGNAEIGRTGQVLKIKILKIEYSAPGEILFADIKTLLHCIAPEFYKEVVSAAINNAKEKFESSKKSLVTT